MRRNIIAFTILAVAALAAPVYFYVFNATSPPETREEMNEEFDQEVLAYIVVNDTPHVMVEWGDNLIWEDLEPKLRRSGMEWNWDGGWTVVEPATGAGSAQLVRAQGKPVMIGQILDADIVTVRINLADAVVEESVEAPGYAVLLPDATTQSDVQSVHLLNESGDIVWSSAP